MIGFVAAAAAVRFTVDRTAIERAQLHVSSRLLALGVPPPEPGR
jgi:YfiR/HmsC-like